ncbi:MAG TPA: hypothetical protein PLT87_02680 [Spirochaetales bacterium]|nr:hypothetical protein [Spirochaetales bacterium]
MDWHCGLVHLKPKAESPGIRPYARVFVAFALGRNLGAFVFLEEFLILKDFLRGKER